MNIEVLAQVIVSFLGPFLPYLVKVGEKAAEEAGKQLGVSAWERARALWNKLRPEVEAKQAVGKAVQEVAKTPNDEGARAALRLQLEELLIENKHLAHEVSKLIKEDPETMASSVINQSAGDGAIQIGQISGDTHIHRTR
jgi:hypothetical protein